MRSLNLSAFSSDKFAFSELLQSEANLTKQIK